MDWTGLYREGWQGEIVPEAFSHPAKFAPGLIRHIYDHVAAEGWIAPGDTVVDPFAGVALGALHALQHGLNWVGCELEPKFVALAEQNIALWNRRYSLMPRWGTARIAQGDSRRLREVIGAIVGVTISSPPFGDQEPSHAQNDTPSKRRLMENVGVGHSMLDSEYSSTPGNLGNLPARRGDFDLALSSPPYVAVRPEKNSQGVDRAKQFSSYKSQGGGQDFEGFCRIQDKHSQGYGNSEGQLSAMKTGDVAAVVGSPPFSQTGVSDHAGQTNSIHKTFKSGGDKFLNAEYGTSPGQLGAMKTGDVGACVSSPPYEGTHVADAEATNLMASGNGRKIPDGAKDGGIRYGEGDMGTGDTFWSASRTILEQVHAVLRHGGHAIWVLKAFVKKGQIVDFPGQWQALCESVGFRTIHVHRAWLVEDHGTQGALVGDEKRHRTERKSFFRRLAEKKGSPRIDWEIVLCTEKT